MNLDIKRIAETPVKLVVSGGKRIGAFYGRFYFKQGHFPSKVKEIIQTWEGGNHVGTEQGTST